MCRLIGIHRRYLDCRCADNCAEQHHSCRAGIPCAAEQHDENHTRRRDKDRQIRKPRRKQIQHTEPNDCTCKQIALLFLTHSLHDNNGDDGAQNGALRIGRGKPPQHTNLFIRIGVRIGAGHRAQNLHQHNQSKIDDKSAFHGLITALARFTQKCNKAQRKQRNLHNAHVIGQIIDRILPATVPRCDTRPAMQNGKYQHDTAQSQIHFFVPAQGKSQSACPKQHQKAQA